tara:strand:- start:2563 stop:2802 length:240 start_codon:yes stop_codon:yes gene_type:complete
MKISPRVIEELSLIAAYNDNNDDWLSVKKYLLISLPAEIRKEFSSRNRETNKLTLNKFESLLIDIYNDMTGIELRIKDE